jgi:hypothetical protein
MPDTTTSTKIGPDLYERMVDRLRHAELYSEDARELIEAAREVDDDG